VTCHNGVYKPLYGAKMVKDYPALWGAPGWDAITGPLDVNGAPIYDGKPLTAPVVTPKGARLTAAPSMTAAAAGVQVAMGITPAAAMPAPVVASNRPTR